MRIVLYPFAFAALLLGGCANPPLKFQTRHDPSYQGKLAKVLIVGNDSLIVNNHGATRELGRDFFGRFLARLRGSLAQKNVTSETIKINMNDLDPNAPARSAVSQYRPEQVFDITVTRLSTQTQDGLVDFTVTMTFSIEDAQTRKTVWRADTQFGSESHPEDVSDQLVNQLEMAQLL
jgi:hypothetical protein